MTNRLGIVMRRAILLSLVALVIGGLLIYRDFMGPVRAWERTIHGADREARRMAWTRLQRDKEIRGLDHEATIRQVYQAFDDPDPEIRRLAASSLSTLDPKPIAAIERLGRLLDDDDEAVREHAASALGEVVKRDAPGREPALAAIARALADASPTVRLAAVSSLGQVIHEGSRSLDPLRVGRADDPALPLAEGRLGDADPAVRIEAAYVLACNDRGSQAVPMLIRHLTGLPESEPPTRSAERAYLALMVLAIHSDEAALYLGKSLERPNDHDRVRPREALAWVARQTPEARARVRRVAGGLLGPDNPSVRHVAGLLLHEIGSDQAAIPILIEALKDNSVEVRLLAIEALADVGAADPAVVPALEEVANDKLKVVRDRAAAALEAIELAEMIPEADSAR